MRRVSCCFCAPWPREEGTPRSRILSLANLMAEDESIEINRRWMCNIFHILLVAGLDLKAQDSNSVFEAKGIFVAKNGHVDMSNLWFDC